MSLGEMMSSRGTVAAAVLIAAAGIGAFLAPETASPGAMSTDPVETPVGADPAPVSVHVAGWVLDPGVVRVPSGSLVADAIAAAGGAVPGARLDLVNLASPVVDGAQIEVPGPDPSQPVDAGDGLISLNTAGIEDLERLPGVGPVLAERIVAHREANGPFSVVEDLLGVSGIGEAKLAAIRDLVSVP
jgi:competence protein ComEA